MPAYDALLEELLAHATGRSSLPEANSSLRRGEYHAADASFLDTKASGLGTFLTATVSGSEYAEDDEEAWLHNLCGVVGNALKKPTQNQSDKDLAHDAPEQRCSAAKMPEVTSRRSSPLPSNSCSEAVAPEAGMQNHLRQSFASARTSPPLAPGSSTLHGRRPRIVGQGGKVARRPSSGEEPSQSSRAQERERLIAEQLKCEKPAEFRSHQFSEERFKASVQTGEHTPRQKKLSRIGTIYTGPAIECSLRSMSTRRECFVECSIGSIPPLELRMMFGSGGLEALPASDLPDYGRAAVLAWAWGSIGGKRCILELEASAPLSAGAGRTKSGRPQWHTLAALCGLPGCGAFASNSGIFGSNFSASPQTILQEAVRSVRKEAALDSGPITIEELHLGLRALELRARNDDDSLFESSDGSIGSRLKVQAWRELLRAFVESGRDSQEDMASAAKAASENGQSLAQVLTRALALGSAGVAQEAQAQPLEALRAPPMLWEECISVLSAMSRTLKKDLEIVQSISAYAMLGIDPGASDAELKRAYRDQCLLYHPDKGGDTAAFQELQRAYEKVIDERKRGIRPPQESFQEASTKGGKAEKDESTGKHRPQAEHAKTAGTCSGFREDTFAPRGAEQQAETTETDVVAEMAAQARAEELLMQVEQFCKMACEAADRAQAARNACEAATSVVVRANEHMEATCSSRAEIAHVGACEAYWTAREAASELLTATRAVTEGTGSVAAALGEISVRLLPASGPVMDGDRAEELMSAATQCASQASSTEGVALSCGNMVETISDMLTTLGENDDEIDFDLECAQLSLHVLASTAKKGLEVVCEAAASADAAARVSQQILNIAKGAARASGNAKFQSRHHSARCQHTSQTTENATPPRMPQASGKPGGTQIPSVSSKCNSPPSRQSSPKSSETSGIGTPRGGSLSGRARTDALVQRRLKLFEELSRLNDDVRALQTNLLDALIRCPPLLPSASTEQSLHIFEVIGEYLSEAINDLRHISDSMDLCTELPELLPWLPLNNPFEGSALADSRSGILRLGALLDIEALASMLLDQFFPLLLEAQPAASESRLRNLVTQCIQNLRNWISAKSQ